MPLVNCPDCGAGVSSLASSCPGCARPLQQSGLAPGKLNPVHTGRIVTIEKTGKGPKLLGALCFWALATSAAVLIYGLTPKGHKHQGTVFIGALGTMLAIAGLVIVRVLKWWRHG